ncbi:MAG TPA: cell division ATP-binding protein FtsE [Rhodanobacteraceae bacterium]|nr:cell division ATP-binding protein FtsE [Rhodanobacteraceae bacterium]
MIQFDRVAKRYAAGNQALTDISFSVDAGEMVFITGHSGAGKSTLLKLIAAVERADRGSVTVDGRNLAKLRPRDVPVLRRRQGMVFQDHQLLADRSVADNVQLPLVIAGVAREERRRRVRAALDKVGLLEREQAMPAALSTGEQQRVGIARAIIGKPPLLLADEPTGNLDPQLALEIMRLFASFRDVGTTVLIASHDLALIKRMRQRVVVLDHGRLVDDVAAMEVA